MRKSAQITLLQIELKTAKRRIETHEIYLKCRNLENDFDEWFWSEPESG